MKIHLRENNFNNMFLITESKNSSRAKNQTTAILSQRLHIDPSDERINRSESFFRREIFDSMHLPSKQYDRVIMYEPMLMNCAIDIGFPYDLNMAYFKKYSDHIIKKTKDSENPSEIITYYKNRIKSINDLEDVVGEEINALNDETNEKASQMEVNLNQNYDVLGPLTFEQAQVYGNESGDNGSGRICYTQNEVTWNSSNYSNKNQNKCYLLLRKDWKVVPCMHDGSEARNVLHNGLNELSEHNGYDNYGLSMIFVFITPYGDLHECNTRWNHEANYARGRGVDFALTENDISNLMGAPFEKVFGVEKINPYNAINKEIAEKGILNVCKVAPFSEGIATIYVKINRSTKYNFITKDNRVLWNKPVQSWFDAAENFRYGFAHVVKEINTGGSFNIHKENYIDKQGKLVTNQWFNEIRKFYNQDLFYVKLRNKRNVIKLNGEQLYDTWFDDIVFFKDACVVKLGDKYNFARYDGTYIYDKPVNLWFDEVSNFFGDIAIVKYKDKFNYIDINGNFVWQHPLEEWFDVAGEFGRYFACINIANKGWNFIDKQGNLISESWFDNVQNFEDFTIEDDIVMVIKKGKINCINQEGKLLSKIWFDSVDDEIYYDRIKVGVKDKYNFMDLEGNLVWKHPIEEWFDDCSYFYEGYSIVEVFNKGYNILDTNGKLLSKQWFSDAGGLEDYDDEEGLFYFILNGKEYTLSYDGDVYDEGGNLVNLSESRNPRKRYMLVESKNSSRAKKQSIAILANMLSIAPDDERLIEIENQFRSGIFDHLSNKEYDRVITYEPMLIKCAVDAGFPNNFDAAAFKEYSDYIINKTKNSTNPSETINSYRGRINSFEDLKNIVGSEKKADDDAMRERMSKMEINLNQNYDVLGPLSFEESQVYGNKSGNNGRGKICYTQGKDTWLSSNYSNDDNNKCYLLLRKDWESVPCVHDGSEANNGLGELSKYNGYDDYGLSMIFIFVNPHGYLYKSNTRWNHEALYAPNHGVDFALNEEDVANLIGAPFEQVLGIERVDPSEAIEKIKKALENGEEWFKLFDNVTDAYEGFKIVELNGKHNYVHKVNGVYKLLWDEPFEDWFDFCDFFDEGFARVKKNGSANFITKEGRILCDEWYDMVRDFYHGAAKVKKDGKYNFVGEDGNLISKIWFDVATSLESDYTNDGSMCQYAYVGVFVEEKMKCNAMRPDGTFVWNKPTEEWFDSMQGFYQQRAIVKINEKYNIIDDNGNLIWREPLEKWFDFVERWNSKYCHAYKVIINNVSNFIKPDGKLYWDHPVEEWFRYASLTNSCARMRVQNKEGKHNIVDNNGELLSDLWFDLLTTIQEVKGSNQDLYTMYYVKINNRCNILFGSGRFLWNERPDKWLSEIYGNFNLKGYIKARYNDDVFYLDKQGNIVN